MNPLRDIPWNETTVSFLVSVDIKYLDYSGHLVTHCLNLGLQYKAKSFIVMEIIRRRKAKKTVT